MLTDSADPAYAAPPVLTVTALNQQVARLLERTFPLVWIGGEISNFTRAASGHWYFTLKDDAAQVRAVMFRSRAQFAGFQPREGDKVEVRALVTLYGARGDYQINVEAIRRAGVGQLFEAFLRLKERLGAMGLFDPERKRALPLFARAIGIVTSPQAAALRDVLTALRRRAPHVRVILYPAPVQGQGAAERIAQAIRTASARAEVDVLLVCRGGGSIEDLWSFNEEVVAHAIVGASMPVISGVGHETDFTIADFSADLRAATPTAAAELAATAHADWFASLRGDALDLHRAMQRQLAEANQGLDNL
ncbi:exodeoxyribonuclease VII large subunit, partial [Massilia arenosa]